MTKRVDDMMESTWADLDDEYKRALLQMADNKVTWDRMKEIAGRFKWLWGTAAAGATGWYALRDQIAQTARIWFGG